MIVMVTARRLEGWVNALSFVSKLTMACCCLQVLFHLLRLWFLQVSHMTSLRELLHSHTVIKVQINQHDQNQVGETCQQLAAQSNARLLQIKGRTALFMQANTDVDVLRQSSSSQRPSEHHQASKQHLERVWHNPEEADSPVQLHADVQAQLRFLTSAGVLSADELDKRCLK